MPSINPLLLRKVLVFAGTGGSPLIYYGSSSDIFSEGLRKFKLSLSLDLENQSSKSNSGTKQDETWTLSKDTWQGISEEKWKQLIETETRSIYKLFIKSESIQGERAEKGIKGLIGLSKIKLGSEGAKGTVEEITKEESQNIWLIIAKGEKSIYLMPSVVSNPQDVGSGSSNATEQEKKIWKEGVIDINGWKAGNEQFSEWDKAKNKKLHESIQKGFIVARGGKYMSKTRSGGTGMPEQDYEGWLRLKNFGMNISETMGNVQDGEVFYNNTGIVWGKKGEQKLGWLVIEKWNEQREKYFPLDIFVLGDSSKMKKKFAGHKSLIQEIEVEDKINEAIGVRLDQVVISETGIGEGEKNEIKWGTIKRPTWTQELLK
ncbi:hypothetical protein WEN_02530 [Mycoplasma wenyonii str. Massachusetts]|uniref:Uncharacterized protein n=1 Tax=Mycoplasma wenyonii (strain Massachusetts) TaxID=1197325 RepID=I6YBD2_MYCWM|nr:hypothetical protein [Mycoplasma wenyonii]AFN65291.1 hypothetical protein WEN_02530 [Mycoplasma wenyonii str. Massachusetts]